MSWNKFSLFAKKFWKKYYYFCYLVKFAGTYLFKWVCSKKSLHKYFKYIFAKIWFFCWNKLPIVVQNLKYFGFLIISRQSRSEIIKKSLVGLKNKQKITFFSKVSVSRFSNIAVFSFETRTVKMRDQQRKIW